jgi:esterase/lipase superfamily enzyme
MRRPTGFGLIIAAIFRGWFRGDAAVRARSWLLAVFLLAASGCGTARTLLMPTPNLYAEGLDNPFVGVPVELQNNKVDVMYMTDRAPEGGPPEWRTYGYQRSRSIGFGLAEVRIGDDVSWADLVKASLARYRIGALALGVSRVMELGRFAETPRSLIELPGSADARATDASEQAAEEQFRKTLAEQLSHTPVKDVYLFVHGYANTFDDGVKTVAQIWHFLGRQGAPMAYSWPAGRSGLLRGYTYDRESSEFTVYHFKQMLRLIASCPDVRKVHLIGHSRGTDVVTTGVRELHLELTGQGKPTREVLKLGTMVLAAPDMDFDVVVQRLMTARIGHVPERAAIYVCSNDEALGVANWLFGGLKRLGQLKSDMFSPAEIDALRRVGTPQVIDARVSEPGAFGHDYFHSNPAVSSDLILLLRYQYAPGAENGRPLGVNEKGFWVIENDYPKNAGVRAERPKSTPTTARREP